MCVKKARDQGASEKKVIKDMTISMLKVKLLKLIIRAEIVIATNY